MCLLTFFFHRFLIQLPHPPSGPMLLYQLRDLSNIAVASSGVRSSVPLGFTLSGCAARNLLYSVM